MKKNSKVLVKHLSALCVAMGLAFGALAGGAQVASALSAPTFSWRVSTLSASSSIARETVWTSNSTGALTWQVSGDGCTRQGERIATSARGVCTVRVKYAASKIHSAIETERSLNVVSATTVAPKPTTAPTTTTAPRPTVAPTSTFKFPFTPKNCTNNCVVGDFGPGGGTVFYVAPRPFTSVGSGCGTNCRYLEVSKHAGTMGWCDANLSSTSVGRTGLTIGSGMANTEFAAWKKNGDTKCRTGAIKRAYDYSSKGTSDWFLPSIDELIEMNRFVLAVIGADRQKGGMLLNERGIQYLGTDVVFWSSSEINQKFVWVEYLGLTMERQWQKNESGSPFAIFVRAF